MFSYQTFLTSLTLLLSVFVGTSSSLAAETPKQKNVLLLIADDLGSHLGCYGDASARTPNLDRFAGEGTRFSNAFANVASCSPSRATILTGLHVHQNGQYGLAHAAHHQATFDWVQSLPKLLNESGYRTAILGKNHLQTQMVYPYAEELKPTEGTTRSPAGMSESAKAFFARTSDQPFFLVVGFTDPHRVRARFANDEKSKDYESQKFDPTTLVVPAFLPDTPEVRADLADYYQAISRLDEAAGQTLKALDDTGHRDDTLVLFVSDNGMPFPGAKTNVYDAGTHLPLLIRQPGASANVNAAMVSWIDLMPTILDWTGVKPPKYALPGKSLLPQLSKEDDAARDTVFASHVFHEIDMYYPMRSIRTRQHRLIWNLAHELPFRPAGDIDVSASYKSIQKTGEMGKRTLEGYLHRAEFEMYDITSDPDEVKNLAADAAHAGTLKDLKDRLMKMMRETKDPWMRGRDVDEQ